MLPICILNFGIILCSWKSSHCWFVVIYRYWLGISFCWMNGDRKNIRFLIGVLLIMSKLILYLVTMSIMVDTTWWYFNDYEYSLRDNVRYVNNKSVCLRDMEIFFSTLWSPIKEEEILSVQMGLTDCHRIIYKGRHFTFQDYKEVHMVSDITLSWSTFYWKRCRFCILCVAG